MFSWILPTEPERLWSKKGGTVQQRRPAIENNDVLAEVLADNNGKCYESLVSPMKSDSCGFIHSAWIAPSFRVIRFHATEIQVSTLRDVAKA